MERPRLHVSFDVDAPEFLDLARSEQSRLSRAMGGSAPFHAHRLYDAYREAILFYFCQRVGLSSQWRALERDGQTDAINAFQKTVRRLAEQYEKLSTSDRIFLDLRTSILRNRAGNPRPSIPANDLIQELSRFGVDGGDTHLERWPDVSGAGRKGPHPLAILAAARMALRWHDEGGRQVRGGQRDGSILRFLDVVFDHLSLQVTVGLQHESADGEWQVIDDTLRTIVFDSAELTRAAKLVILWTPPSGVPPSMEECLKNSIS